jgi:hypothetical protein
MKQILVKKTDIESQQKHVGKIFNMEDVFFRQSQETPAAYFEAINQTAYFTIRVKKDDYEPVEDYIPAAEEPEGE